MQAVSIKLDLPLRPDVDAIFINDCVKKNQLKSTSKEARTYFFPVLNWKHCLLQMCES